ncbi:MAG: hypothetical protein MI924_04825 [Chloroflexales bacterium]|nr:hypothetical protein [Chloroflexales bacterium]
MSRSARNTIGVVCIGLISLVEIGLGIVYFTSPTVMPYHQEALGVDWARLEPGVRTMLVTLVNGYGSTHFAVGVALGVLLFFPLRRGERWARWAALAIGFPVLAATAHLSARLALATGAGVPWFGAVVLLLLFILGVALVQPRAAAEQGVAADAPPAKRV